MSFEQRFSSGFRKSFNDPTWESMKEGWVFVAAKEDLISRQFSTLNHQSGKDALVTMRSNAAKSFEQALLYSAIEASALQIQHPELVITVTFPELYRFLRATELYSRVPRGGYTLFVGAGAAVPEYIAQYIEPPSINTITKSVSKWEPDYLSNKVEGNIDSFYKREQIEAPLNLMDGVGLAIEPDPQYQPAFELQANYYRIPQRSLFIGQNTIQEVLAEDSIPSGLDTVLWNRADPLIAALPNSSVVDMAEIDKIIVTLASKLRVGGNFAVSVGGGNGQYESFMRQTFMKNLIKTLPKADLDPITGIPMELGYRAWEDDKPLSFPYGILLGNPASGLTDVLVASRSE